MTTFQKVFNGVIILGMVVLLFLVASPSKKLGGVYEQVASYFYDGIFVGTTNQYSISNTGAVTTSGSITTSGNLTATTALGATTTLTVGRTQTYATSSATRICLDYNTQATTTLAGTANGVVTWKYGACN